MSKKNWLTVVWQDFALAVQLNVPVVILDSMFPGVSTTVQQAVNVLFLPTCAKQHFLQSLRWKPSTDRDWTLKTTYRCVCQTYHHVWTNYTVNNRHTLHTEYSTVRTRLVIRWLIGIVTISICAMMYMHELLTSWIWGLWGSAIWEGHVLGVRSMKKFETSEIQYCQIITWNWCLVQKSTVYCLQCINISDWLADVCS